MKWPSLVSESGKMINQRVKSLGRIGSSPTPITGLHCHSLIIACFHVNLIFFHLIACFDVEKEKQYCRNNWLD